MEREENYNFFPPFPQFYPLDSVGAMLVHVTGLHGDTPDVQDALASLYDNRRKYICVKGCWL